MDADGKEQLTELYKCTPLETFSNHAVILTEDCAANSRCHPFEVLDTRAGCGNWWDRPRRKIP
jgi:hypothetical protein